MSIDMRPRYFVRKKPIRIANTEETTINDAETSTLGIVASWPLASSSTKRDRKSGLIDDIMTRLR